MVMGLRATVSKRSQVASEDEHDVIFASIAQSPPSSPDRSLLPETTERCRPRCLRIPGLARNLLFSRDEGEESDAGLSVLFRDVLLAIFLGGLIVIVLFVLDDAGVVNLDSDAAVRRGAIMMIRRDPSLPFDFERATEGNIRLYPKWKANDARNEIEGGRVTMRNLAMQLVEKSLELNKLRTEAEGLLRVELGPLLRKGGFGTDYWWCGSCQWNENATTVKGTVASLPRLSAAAIARIKGEVEDKPIIITCDDRLEQTKNRLWDEKKRVEGKMLIMKTDPQCRKNMPLP